MVKYCTGCGVTKNTSEFHKSKAQKDGLVSQCKKCKSAYRKKYYNINRKSLIEDSIDWHIDHIKPLNKFDLKNKKDLNKACHYSNLQALWASENLSKKDSYGEGNE